MDTKRITSVALVVFVSFAMAFACTYVGVLQRFDDWCQDIYHVLAGKRHDASNTIIVSLDDQTLAAHPDTPLVFWGPLYAKSFDRLKAAGASVVALDIHLGITPSQWLHSLGVGSKVSADLIDYDQEFDLSLSEGKIILAANLVRTGGEIRVRFPAMEYLSALGGGINSIGLTTLNRDPDNSVRKYVLAYELSGASVSQASRPSPNEPLIQPAWRTFAAAAVYGSYGEGTASTSLASAPYQPRPIAYCGPPGTIPRLPLASVLREEGLTPQERDLVKGRIVFVGVEFEGAGDRLPTPYSQGLAGFGHRDMSNVEIHANIAETLLNPGRVTASPLWLAALIWLPFLIGSALACDRFSPWKGNGIKLLVIISGWCVGLLFFIGGVLLPVSGLVFGQSCVYVGIAGLRLTRTERARARIKAIFGKYVSGSAVEQILRCGGVPELGGSCCRVTVLFSDIRNFTVLNEHLNPEEVVELLNTYFPGVCDLVQKNGGMVNKFIGDAVMCVFGPHLGCQNHARQAVATALELQVLALRFQEWVSHRFPSLGPDSFRIGVGLHTGDAVLGNIGSTERMEYTVIGDTVNTASRLEGLTKELGWSIVSSEETLHEAGPGIVVGRKAIRHVKGKRMDVSVVEVLGMDEPKEVL